jgi:2-hydroxy-3-oxopropionate reductase
MLIMEKVGFIGLGIMGKPMVSNLYKAGLEVMVNDLDENIAKEIETASKGLVKFADKETIGAECKVIMCILPSAGIVDNILFGEGGLAKTMKPGTIFVDFSSETSGQSKDHAEKLAKTGVKFIDAPVSGGEPGAINGTLSIMVGAEEEDFNAVKPYFDILGGSAVLIGGTGSGSVTKLVNQAIVNLNIATVGEAFTFAAKAGVDPEKVYNAIKGGLAGSQVLHDKVPMILDRNFKPGGTIKVNSKDIKNVLDTAHQIDSPMPLTALLFEIQQSCKVAGGYMDDHCGYVKFFERLAGVEVKRI